MPRRCPHDALGHLASHHCGLGSVRGHGHGRMSEGLSLPVGWWFHPGALISSTSEADISILSSSLFHRLNITLAVAWALSPNKPNTTISLHDLVAHISFTFKLHALNTIVPCRINQELQLNRKRPEDPGEYADVTVNSRELNIFRMRGLSLAYPVPHNPSGIRADRTGSGRICK